jgi:hypothetical protein
MKTFNLDDPNEVEDFIIKYGAIKGRELAELLEFKDCAISIIKANYLADYAFNKWISIRYRKEGEISKALHHENICEWIYNKMPDDIKW